MSENAHNNSVQPDFETKADIFKNVPYILLFTTSIYTIGIGSSILKNIPLVFVLVITEYSSRWIAFANEYDQMKWDHGTESFRSVAERIEKKKCGEYVRKEATTVFILG